jgi:rfaE bifunctional protein nucleotidyltransferase chain/domain
MKNPTSDTPVLSWEKAADLIQELQQKGKRIISTNGCFDLLHVGHVSYLEQARALGDFLIVAINTDHSVKKLKGTARPLNDELARARVLRALRSVDAVCLFDEDTPVKWLETIRPDIHVKGGDYKVEQLPETAALKSWGGKVQILPFVEGFSTTQLISKSKKISG